VGEDAQRAKSPKISGDWVQPNGTNESELKKGTRTLKIIGLAGANCRFLSHSTENFEKRPGRRYKLVKLPAPCRARFQQSVLLGTLLCKRSIKGGFVYLRDEESRAVYLSRNMSTIMLQFTSM